MSHEIDLTGISVCIGMPSSRDINPLVVQSLFATRDVCGSRGIPCSLAMVSGNAIVQWARDEVLQLLLESDSNRFFFIDSDIVWKPEEFMKLLALTKVRDVVCASYTAKRDEPTFFIRYDTSKPLMTDEYGLFKIQGAGLGFTVMKREVVESVVKSSGEIYDEISKKSYPSVFEVGSINGNRRGEDMSFFDSIADLGYDIYMDPTMDLGHIGTKVYYGKVMDAFISDE